MNEFSFEDSAWELMLRGLRRGGSMSAVRFLTVLEGEEEDDIIEEKNMGIKLSKLLIKLIKT